MDKSKLLLALLLFFVSTTSFASPQWRYIQLDLSAIDSLSNSDNVNTAAGIRGVFGFANIVHIGGAWGREDIEFRTGPMTTRTQKNDAYRLWIGLHPSVSESTDLFFELGGGRVGIDEPVCTSSLPPICPKDPGFVDLTGGIRSMVAEKLELNAAIAATNFDDVGLNVAWSVGGQFRFTPLFSIGLNYDADRIIIGTTGNPTVNGGLDSQRVSALVLNFRLGFD